MKAKSLIPVFTESVPASLEPGNLYVSMLYETAVHLCACGCGTKVVTPFGPHDWAITFDGTVSLRPSVGNGQQACRSHYYIRNDRIDWLPPISKWATQSASARDRAAHAQRSAPPVPKPWWRRAWDRIRRANRATKKANRRLTSCSTAPGDWIAWRNRTERTRRERVLGTTVDWCPTCGVRLSVE